MMKKVISWFPWMERKKNNKGATLVMVIAVLALIGIMVSIIMSVSVLNYKMKLTDVRAKDMFYSVETALDEIRSGLQKDVSDAMSAAYVQTMTNYVNLDDDGRTSMFQTEYIKCLRKKLAEDDSTRYDVEYLESLLQKTAFDEENGVGAKLDTSVQNSLNVTTKGMVLKNVTVTYRDADNYESEIKTDIVMQFPAINFYDVAKMPDLLQYSLIANEQFTASGTVSGTIRGNAYIGKKGAVLNTASVTFSNVGSSGTKELLVTNGGLHVMNGSSLTVEDKELWTKDILVDASSAKIQGSAYVSNDLIINNSMGQDDAKPSVSVKMSGDYYGYGSIKTAQQADALLDQTEAIINNPAEYSSAVVVNGAKATVDLSALKTLMLAGNAYISASSKNDPVATEFPTGMGNKDVVMGESISIKSNQMAYLVPAECIAPQAAGGGKNPMTASQYKTLQEEIETTGDSLVDLTGKIVGSYNSTLQELGVSGYQVVCYPVRNIGSMVYVFMQFNNETSANNFFIKYYNIARNLTKLGGYLDLYTDAIKVPESMDLASDNEVFYYNGNIVVNDEGSAEKFYMNKLQTVTNQDQIQLASNQIAYQNKFYALGKKLIWDYGKLTSQEKSAGRDVYSNIVDSFRSADLNKNITGRKTFVTLGENPVGAILIDGDYTIDNARISGVNAAGETVSAELRVVIATGNVTVKADFEGLIIAKGEIILETNPITISASPSDVALALKAEDGNGIRPLDYLLNGEEYIMGGMITVNGNTENQSIKIADLITYENWKKQ